MVARQSLRETFNTINCVGWAVCYACQDTVYRNECCSPSQLPNGASHEIDTAWRHCKRGRMVDVSSVHIVGFFSDCLIEHLQVSVVRIRPPPLDFPCLGLGNLAVSQPSCFLRVAWQLGTGRVLQLNTILHLKKGEALCTQTVVSSVQIRNRYGVCITYWKPENIAGMLGQPGSIPDLVLPSGGMAARHRKGATAERLHRHLPRVKCMANNAY
ncbi:hypothetical protein T265_08319 [Opisthorchis viverrini]|uniref:Uncharacterized protein n=1 Tax=Opisthorchis viverrini TaxID=6198 RepID=A0A074ZKL4_OPIVI|nr:hypothetical protein T265_08319 [Opisthorchis viverrini]KER23900.1 hypothetical protein T265_08319 [Opisthorchis viverrini]